MRSTDNSGSNSPYQQQQQPNFVQNPSGGISTASRLQPPPQPPPPTSTMGSYISPRGSPTPSSVSSVNQAGPGDNGPPGDPNSISAYSDGGTTYFYNPDEVPPVSYFFYWIKTRESKIWRGEIKVLKNESYSN